MTKLPILTPKRLERILLDLGFMLVRQKGSHALYKHPDGRLTTIPHHQGRVVARPLLREILRQINLSPPDLLKHLEDR